jgi:glutaredoxin-related protein
MTDHIPSRSFSQIYIDGKLIGGCSELKALHSAGKLESLLA